MRRAAAPLTAALVAGAVAFAAVALLAGGDGDGERAASTAAATTTVPAASTAAGTTTAPAPTGQAARGAAVFAAMGCGGCHRLAAAGSSGQIGPDLDDVLPGHTAASLRAFILHPTPGTPMPEDFGQRMTPAQLDALVAFLLA